jgi:signal transduction histidine kinase
MVVAMVEDDGVGFDPEEAARRGRLGLLGVRERVEMLGGRLEIESQPGEGTVMLVEAPVSAGSAATGQNPARAGSQFVSQRPDAPFAAEI